MSPLTSARHRVYPFIGAGCRSKAVVDGGGPFSLVLVRLRLWAAHGGVAVVGCRYRIMVVVSGVVGLWSWRNVALQCRWVVAVDGGG